MHLPDLEHLIPKHWVSIVSVAASKLGKVGFHSLSKELTWCWQLLQLLSVCFFALEVG